MFSHVFPIPLLPVGEGIPIVGNFTLSKTWKDSIKTPQKWLTRTTRFCPHLFTAKKEMSHPFIGEANLKHPHSVNQWPSCAHGMMYLSCCFGGFGGTGPSAPNSSLKIVHHQPSADILLVPCIVWVQMIQTCHILLLTQWIITTAQPVVHRSAILRPSQEASSF